MAVQTLKLSFEWQSQRWDAVEVGLKAFAQATNQSFKRVSPFMRAELKDFLDTIAEAMAQRHSQKYILGERNVSTGPQTGRLSVRSGNLVKTIRRSVMVAGSTYESRGLSGYIGSKAPYARIHEQGGVIKARRAKFLTIPLPAALHANGTPKKRNARAWANTFVLKSKKGNLLIVQKRGKTLIPLYVLKPSVKIPPRLGLGLTLKKTAPHFVDQLADKLARRIVEGIKP